MESTSLAFTNEPNTKLAKIISDPHLSILCHYRSKETSGIVCFFPNILLSGRGTKDLIYFMILISDQLNFLHSLAVIKSINIWVLPKCRLYAIHIFIHKHIPIDAHI